MKTTQTLVAVAAVLLAEPESRHWGYELSKKSGVRSGVMYPLLARLMDAAWLTDGWEGPDETGRGRPPRRYYELTELGEAELGALCARTPAPSVVARWKAGFA